MEIPFTLLMGFLFTVTIGKLFTVTLGIQLTVSNDILEAHFSGHKEVDIAIPASL